MDFKDLVVWQKSMLLVREVYATSNSMPAIERYGLISQSQRAAVSIPVNIAEGRKRRSKGDFVQFLRIANGSAAELETLLLLIEDLYPEVNTKKNLALLLEVQKMLNVMISKLDN